MFCSKHRPTAVFEAELLARNVRRQIDQTRDTSIAFDVLLNLSDTYGLNSAPVAAFIQGLVKR